MAELILGPLIGGLASTRAHVWGRADGPGRLQAWLGCKPDLSDAVLAGSSLPLEAQDGFAGVVPLAGLRPDTLYYYALTLADEGKGDKGEGRVPSPLSPLPEGEGKLSLPAPAPCSFRTFPPDGMRASFAFAFGSCFRPADANGGQIFDALDARRSQDNLRFILMIGDQIYADAWMHNGIGKVASNLDEYRQVYAYTWSRPPFRKLLQNLPAFMILDDHEVDDDWRWTDRGRNWAYIPWWDKLERLWTGRPIAERRIPRQRVLDALQAYWEHQAMHAPPMLRPLTLMPSGQYDLEWSTSGALAYTFNFGAAAFFVLDLRSQRVCNSQERILLGENQWQMLEAWLAAVKDSFPVKFIITSSACLFNFAVDIPQDRWPGFRRERERFLQLIARHDVKNLYLLAGDMHSGHAVRAELRTPAGGSLPIWEFCSSPFEQNPNKLAQYTYWPLRDAPILRQERLFTVAQPNFGLVRVNYTVAARPKVRFELYGQAGNILAEVVTGLSN